MTRGTIAFAFVLLLVVLAGPLTRPSAQSPAAKAPVAVAAAKPADIRIASVAPKSVVAGGSFSVTIELPDDYPDPVTVSVHRFGLGLEQYRSGPIRDNDQTDAAPERGLIVHRVPTNVGWTSAQGFTDPANADRYLVTIAEPNVLQADQSLTVVRSSLSVDAATIRLWLAAVEKSLGTSVSISAGRRLAWKQLGVLGAGDAVKVDSDDPLLFVGQAPQSTTYLYTQDFLAGIPSTQAPKPAAGLTNDAIREMLAQYRQQQLKTELDSIVRVIQQLPKESQPESMAPVDALRRQLGRDNVIPTN